MIAPSVLPTNVPNDDSLILSEPAILETSNKLWVEKYRPKGYIDLLSDETTNQSLLTWLKMWDKMVFNRFVFSMSFTLYVQLIYCFKKSPCSAFLETFMLIRKRNP